MTVNGVKVESEQHLEELIANMNDNIKSFLRMVYQTL